MQKEILLEELYLLLLSRGPGYRSNTEFWDPTYDAVELMEFIENEIASNKKEEK